MSNKKTHFAKRYWKCMWQSRWIRSTTVLTITKVSYEVMLQYIRRTRSTRGFHCRARLDTTAYAKDAKCTAAEQEAVKLKRHPVLPHWNYTIWPHKNNQG